MFDIVEVAADESQALEPMGSKAKFWFEHDELGPCLFKEAREDTGEDWSEKLSAEIAEIMGLPHARYELAISEGARGVVTPRITTAEERLVHGNELLIEIDPGYGTSSARYRTPAHTVRAVVRALRESSTRITLPYDREFPAEVTSAVDLVAGYLLLDTVIANTDRHHENWAVIQTTDEDGTELYRVAPTFDHASSLGRNEPLDRVVERLATSDLNYTVEAYAARARSALYSSADESAPLKPLEAFEEVATYAPESARAWCQRASRVTDDALWAILDEVPAERMPQPFKDFVVRMIRYNREALQEICSDL